MAYSGVILAGGEATRLPNKLLLPTAYGKLVIESSIGLLRQKAIKDIVVVIGPDRILEKVLVMRGHNDLRFVVQPAPLGVPDAISHAGFAIKHDIGLVTFGDNLYGTREIDSISADLINVASVRKSNLPELDGYDEEERTWVGREVPSKLKLAGWLVLHTDRMVCGLPGISLVNFLNAQEIAAYRIYCRRVWYDLGTVAAYTAYLSQKEMYREFI